MAPYNRVQLVVNVIRLYYENGSSRVEIAEQLHVSRSYVSKLLTMAREENIMTVKVRDPLQMESRLEQTIRSYFQLRRMTVTLNKVGESSLNPLCDAVVKYLDSILKGRGSIVTGQGGTMYVLSQRVLPRTDLEGTWVIAVVGMPISFGQSTYCIVSAVDMAKKLGGTPYFLPAPIMTQERTLGTQFLREKHIEEMVDYAAKANITVFTLGDMSRLSFWASRGVMSEGRVQELFGKGAIGDTFLYILSTRGKICGEALGEGTIIMPFRTLKQEGHHIGTAVGKGKIDTVYSALRGGVVNVPVIDEDTAKTTQEKVYKEDSTMRWRE